MPRIENTDTPLQAPISTEDVQDPRELAAKQELDAENKKEALKAATSFGRAATGEAVAGATGKISNDLANFFDPTVKSTNKRLAEFHALKIVVFTPFWLLFKALGFVGGHAEQQAQASQKVSATKVKDLTGDDILVKSLEAEKKGDPAGKAAEEKPNTQAKPAMTSDEFLKKARQKDNEDFKMATGLSDQKAGNER